jgi:predicted nucleic acid-binding Zn ribbon protein
MPTDLEALFARKCEAQRQKESERQTNITMISVWVIICLVMLVLLFVDKNYAQAMQELETMEELIDLF